MGDLTWHVPLRGKLLVQFDHSDEQQVVGEFSYSVPVSLSSAGGDNIYPTLKVMPDFEHRP